MPTMREEIESRRTFAIISHPDAGKTTLTEKLLLYGGAIQTAGSSRASRAPATPCPTGWDIEKTARYQRHLVGFAVPLRRQVHQHPGHPRPPGFQRGHLPHPGWPPTRRSWSSTRPRASRRRPSSCSRSARCGISPFSPSSTRWTGKPATPLS